MIQAITQPPDQPYNKIVNINPDLAAAWLDKNENNRPINWNYVAQLARDMKAGRWRLTHQGIAFDTQGRLIDGQHRLWAVIEADVTVPMRVFFNEPAENIVHIDGNCPRQAAHRITLARTLGTVRADELATLRAMLAGVSLATKRRTLHEEMELLETHRPAVLFAHEQLPGTRPAGIANSMTRAVVARAWYCEPDTALLTRFCEVLRTGMSSAEQERPVVLLRNQLVELRRRGTTRNIRQRQYGLTSRALSAYVNKEPLSVLRVPAYELFLLPEEVEAA